MHYEIPTAQQIKVYIQRTLHFTPVYHSAMRSCISEGEEEVARKPEGFALLVHIHLGMFTFASA